jgi:hypothetical protein
MERYAVKIWALSAILLTGCATTASSIPIHYQFTDKPTLRRIELSYRNASGQTLCLSPSEWPNVAGKLNNWAPSNIALRVASARFPLKNFNTGYCVGGCPIYLAPGKRITGFIAYADFDLPADFIWQPKVLEFSSTAYICRPKGR